MLTDDQIAAVAPRYSQNTGLARAASANMIRRTAGEMQQLASCLEKELGLTIALVPVPPDEANPAAADIVEEQEARNRVEATEPARLDPPAE